MEVQAGLLDQILAGNPVNVAVMRRAGGNKIKDKESRKGLDSQHEKGAVLVVVLLVTVALLIVATPFLFKLSAQYRTTNKSFHSLAAMNLAEAGIEMAIWELNYGDISAWDGDDLLRTYSLPSFQASGGNVIGDILITVASPTGDNPVVESTGQVDMSGDVLVSKTSRVVLTKAGGDPLFDVGVFADESLTIASNVTIEGDVGVNGTQLGALTIGNNTVVDGDATCGPGGDPDLAISLSGSAQVLGEQTAATDARDFPSISAPQGMSYRGVFYAKGITEGITEDGEYSSFELENGAVVEIAGDVTLYVTGLFSLGSNTELRIAEGGRLTLYLSGSLVISSNSAVNIGQEDPTQLVILGTDSLTGIVNFNSNNPFYGALYMPRADLVFSSNVQFYGSAIGKSIELNSNVDLSYAEELMDIEGLPEWDSLFIVKSWQEKR